MNGLTKNFPSCQVKCNSAKADGSGSVTYGDGSSRGKTAVKMSVAGMDMDVATSFTGKRLGACNKG